jgi:hypothetical protein
VVRAHRRRRAGTSGRAGLGDRRRSIGRAGSE